MSTASRAPCFETHLGQGVDNLARMVSLQPLHDLARGNFSHMHGSLREAPLGAQGAPKRNGFRVHSAL